MPFKEKHTLKVIGKRLPMNLLVYVWSIFTLGGVAYIVLGSFKNKRELMRHLWSFPQSFEPTNYIQAWMSAKFSVYFINSAIAVFGSVVLVAMICAPAAYVLSKGRFRFRNTITTYIIMGMGIPIPLLYVPIFVLMTKLHLNDSLTGLTISFVVASIPFSVFLLTGFFSTIPTALREAAVIDGCSEWQIFSKIMLPLAKSGIATTSIFNFVWL